MGVFLNDCKNKGRSAADGKQPDPMSRPARSYRRQMVGRMKKEFYQPGAMEPDQVDETESEKDRIEEGADGDMKKDIDQHDIHHHRQ